MKKYLVIFDVVKMCAFAFGLLIQNAWASDEPTIGELHPPVVISIGQQKISLFFLKNNLKTGATDIHVPDAEVFYSSTFSKKPSFNYVWKIEGDEIVSVFFYDWRSPEKKGKAMYVLTKSRLLNSEFEGVSYSTMEFPIIENGKNVTVSFFPKDLPDAVLQNCSEGRNLISGESVSCIYKNAGDIKKHLVAQDR